MFFFFRRLLVGEQPWSQWRDGGMTGCGLTVDSVSDTSLLVVPGPATPSLVAGSPLCLAVMRECCLCRKQRKIKWSVGVRLHQVDRKCASGEMARRSATAGCPLFPFPVLEMYYHNTNKHHTLSPICFHSLCYVFFICSVRIFSKVQLFSKAVRQTLKLFPVSFLKTKSLQFSKEKSEFLSSPKVSKIQCAITLWQ